MTAHPSVSYLDDSIFPIVYERKHHHNQNCDTGQVLMEHSEGNDPKFR